MELMKSLLLIFLAGNAFTDAKSISKYFDICSRNQSEQSLSKCVLSSIRKSSPLIVKGIPELSIGSIDPLFVDHISMKENSGRFKFSQSLSNLTITGMRDFSTRDLSISLKSLTLNLTTDVKSMRFEGDYIIDGQIMVIPISGAGHASYNFSDVTLGSRLKFKTITKSNKTYLKVESFKLKIDAKKGRVHLSNLFNGNEPLGKLTNSFMNENFIEIFETYKPLPEEAFAKVYRKLIDSIFSRYSMDELFPK